MMPPGMRWFINSAFQKRPQQPRGFDSVQSLKPGRIDTAAYFRQSSAEQPAASKALRFAIADRDAGPLLHVRAPTLSFSSGNQGCGRTFPSMGHYRIYQLDPSDHITAGFSVECGSDAAAMRAARTLLERSAGVEVWKSSNCLAHLSPAGRGWAALRNPWSA
jgi:hypothetical protein